MNMVKVFADFRTQDLGPFTAKEKKRTETFCPQIIFYHDNVDQRKNLSYIYNSGKKCRSIKDFKINSQCLIFLKKVIFYGDVFLFIYVNFITFYPDSSLFLYISPKKLGRSVKLEFLFYI